KRGRLALFRKRRHVVSLGNARKRVEETDSRVELSRLPIRIHGDPASADRAVASWTAPVLWRFRLDRGRGRRRRRGRNEGSSLDALRVAVSLTKYLTEIPYSV